MQINCSPLHRFFTIENFKIKEVRAKDLKLGQYVMHQGVVDMGGEVQRLPEVIQQELVILNENGTKMVLNHLSNNKITRNEFCNSLNLTPRQLRRVLNQKYPTSKDNLNLMMEKGVGSEILDGVSVCYTNKHRELKMPKELDINLSQILGYFLGDGSYEIDRLNFHERDEETAKYYQERIINTLKINTTLRFRKIKNYYLIRTYSRELVKLFKKEFPEMTTSKESLIPSKILKSKNEIVAAFLTGLFDAEGFVDKDEVGITMKNKPLVSKMHLLLLRFGIVCSLCYAGRDKWSVRITDKESLFIF